jgi:hypothetical protein
MTTPVDDTRVTCPKCGYWLERTYWNREQSQRCIHCQTNLRLLVFPIAVEPAAPPPPNPNAADGDATCYYHSGKQAHAPCAVCGRFLCIVCDIDFRGEHWCPSCLKLQSESQAEVVFQRTRMRFDSLALILVTIPALVFWPTLLCAPIAIFLAIGHWNDDPGFLPRTKVRLYLAVLIGVLQIGGWIALAMFIFTNWHRFFK